MAIRYENLIKDEFDAIVTGELTHLAIGMESQVDRLIGEYFITDADRYGVFESLILRRDGLTHQDKIEIVKSMLPLMGVATEIATRLRKVLDKVEEFKSWRNAMAHGRDVTPDPYDGVIVVETVSRSGKKKRREVSPALHRDTVEKNWKLLDELANLIEQALGQASGHWKTRGGCG